ncbi:uncharacterized protein F5891DRAFT_981196 [Suillus fuscotomentosus]|uniref:Uncharacterized protein n=1 Tax=Suillus fuscotomentosus TaxID=1912939 RepID=A0AAD4E4B0_9AGAM|nr:uncharacterized protein F5891DRAFT_981196 [Suillus fuscotomentosus]KAG1899436.1 hypothetical protein F5891DRAFT_981196 [Suillus fuscotomentosus]
MLPVLALLPLFWRSPVFSAHVQATSTFCWRVPGMRVFLMNLMHHLALPACMPGKRILEYQAESCEMLYKVVIRWNGGTGMDYQGQTSIAGGYLSSLQVNAPGPAPDSLTAVKVPNKNMFYGIRIWRELVVGKSTNIQNESTRPYFIYKRVKVLGYYESEGLVRRRMVALSLTG